MEKPSILIIDDERVICNGCRLVLSEKNYLLDTYLDGKSGLKALKENRYDVLLLDMKLPDVDGMVILREARKTHPEMFVIIMTGFSTVQNAVEAMKLGAFDYLTKPFTDDELILAIEKALEKRDLIAENKALRQELLDRFGLDNIIGRNQDILNIFEKITKVAPTDTTVVIHGESGTGKELFARAIHAHSLRSAKRFIAVDCNTFSPSLLESELFGHVKGAFTGAVQDKPGIFEMAQGGTLFMDEISNLGLETQGKLLRILETGDYKPVGGNKYRSMDVRIIAATNKDLKALVDEGGFRDDLYYRLNVFPIYLPPLRERKDDIPLLVYHFLRKFCRKTGKRIAGFSDDALETLVHYKWPGNVRQLKNVVERLIIMSNGETMNSLDLYGHLQPGSGGRDEKIPETVEELNQAKKQLIEDQYSLLQKAFLIKALRSCDGNISRAAQKVGMKRPNFHSLMRKYSLTAES